MNVPLGFELEKNKVCRLKKALYGLKQSLGAWFDRFARVMKALGYKQSQGDRILFFKHFVSRGVTTLLVYVDDIVVTGDDLQGMQTLKMCLLQEFKIKELGKLK